MAQNELVEALPGGPATKPLLKRRCLSDVSTHRPNGCLFVFRIGSVLYAADFLLLKEDLVSSD